MSVFAIDRHSVGIDLDHPEPDELERVIGMLERDLHALKRMRDHQRQYPARADVASSHGGFQLRACQRFPFAF